MSRFKNLIDKEKKVTIGDEEFTLRPLTGADLKEFIKFSEQDKDKVMNTMILLSLQQTDKTITMEDVTSLPLSINMKLVEAVSELNEFA